MPRPIRWVGGFGVDLPRHPDPARAAPIRIRAGAITEGVPHRDLLVSPDHAVSVGGVLLQAQALVNGATIVREPPLGHVSYHHVELERHALLLAEGLASETYLDTGNRGWFSREAGVRPLFPDLAARRSWMADACAPLVLAGPVLTATHAALRARAMMRGHAYTDDPGLIVLADGLAAPLAPVAPLSWRATILAETRTVRLRTRDFVPSEADRAAEDHRRLGLAVVSLRLAGRALPPTAYVAGWHAGESGWRWTDGDGHIHLRSRKTTAILRIRAAPAAPGYWAAEPPRRAA